MDLLLLAPAFSNEARRTAEVSRVTLVPVPALSVASLEGQRQLHPTRLPLTSEASWNAISQLIRQRRFATISAFSQAAGVSYGWTHALTVYLESLEVVTRVNRSVELTNLRRLLDHVGMERPMRTLRAFELPTARDLPAPVLIRNIRELLPDLGPIHVCGLSAASVHGSTLEFPELLQVYAETPASVRNAVAHTSTIRGLFERTNRFQTAMGSRDGMDSSRPRMLEVYSTDRDVGRSSSSLSGVPVVSLQQTLLDCAGLGSTGHRAIMELVRANDDVS